MDKLLEEYLEKTDRYLKSVPASERVDIVKEIKSTMVDLQNNDRLTSEQIITRLGNPKELAGAYLSEVITKSPSFSPRKLISVVTFYSLAGLKGMFVLPIISVLSAGLLICSVIAPIAGIIKFVGFLLGFDVPFVLLQFGSYTAPPLLVLPFSLVYGVILFGAGRGLWKVTIKLIQSFRKNPLSV